MKKIFNISLTAVAILTLAVACNKDVTTTPDTNPEEVALSGETVTIKATLSDALTRVDFTPTITGGKTTSMALAWTQGDKVRVFDHDDREKYDDFTLAAESVGEKVGVFTGTPTHLSGASSYDVEVVNVINGAEVTDGIIEYSYDFYDKQTQPADGDPGDLKYFAKAKGLTDYTDIQFSEISGVLAVSAKLPQGVAGTIKSVDFISSEVLFPGGHELTITLTTPGDADEDDILNLFATLDTEGVENFQDVNLIVRFHAPESDHKVYTRFVVLNWPKMSPNNLNTLNINASQSDKHAGKPTDDGSEGHPYLIGDPYQLKAVQNLMDSEIRFFKLISDIDMGGISWTNINPSTPYKPLNFDGNNRTISNLGNSMFYVFFNSSIKDLTLDNCKATNGTQRGIFAQYVQGNGEHTISNVHINNGVVQVGNGNMGGLIGRINNPSGGTTTATITDCEVTNTSVTGKSTGTGGLIGSIESVVTVTNCSVKGTTVTGNDNAVAVGGIVGRVTSSATFSKCTYEKNGETTATVTGPSKTATQTTSETPFGPGSAYVGGIAGEVSGAASFDDCHVKNATVTVTTPSSNTAYWKNVGGAFGYIHNAGAKVGNTSGCSVENVEVKSYHFPGGFVSALKGGTITNSTVTGLTISGQNFVGGFVSLVDAGTISDCSVAGNTVQSANATVAGFVSYLYGEASLTGNSTSLQIGDVDHKMTTNIGGFAGQVIADATIEDCHATGSTFASGSNVGGFAAVVNAGAVTSCTASGSAVGNTYVGGLIGWINGPVTVSKCRANGNVTAGSTGGGLIGRGGGGLTVANCYATGSVSGANRRRGGILAWAETGTVSISNCYSTSDLGGTFEIGGVVGLANIEGVTVQNCAAWNGKITATTKAANNWSSAAVVGVSYLTGTFTNNYRRPDMDLTAYWGTNANCSLNLSTSFQHPDVSTSAPLTDPNGSAVTSSTMRPYQGKCDASKTLSELASTTLGWSNEVWDFSGPLPLLL